MTDVLRTFPVATLTDRDAEVPLLRDFVRAHGPFDSILDIGAHCSAQFYAPMLREHTAVYHGIDVLPPDDATEAILDWYIVGNANNAPALTIHAGAWDLVVCCSTIEHAGISTYQATDSVRLEQDTLFLRCLALSRRWVWISVPVGRPYVIDGQMSIIHDEQLAVWEAGLADMGCAVTQRFVFNARGPQAGTHWQEHDDRAFAVDVQYEDSVGNQSICVLEIEKP